MADRWVIAAEPLEPPAGARFVLAGHSKDGEARVEEALASGAERVLVVGGPMPSAECAEALDALPGADAVALLDPYALRARVHRRLRPWVPDLTGLRVHSIALWSHAWRARPASGSLRALAVELARGLTQAGLDVRYLSSEASPAWTLGQGLEVSRGLWRSSR